MPSSTFLILASILIAIALLILLIPLLRRPAAQTAALKCQLERLQEAHSAGLIDDGTFAERKAELSARALAMVEGRGTEARSKLATGLAVVMAIAVPFATYALYQTIGNPNALAFSGAAPAPSTQPADPAGAAPDLAQAAEALAARLENNPDDGDGWLLLGRTYRQIERFADARDAFAKAKSLLEPDADILSEYAEALGLASEPRSLVGEPEKLLDQALTITADHQRALWLKGFARRQDGDPQGANAAWSELIKAMEPGSPVHTEVARLVNEVRGELSLPLLEIPATAPAAASSPAPSSTPPAAPSDAAPGLDVAVSLAPELAAKVAEGDTLFVFARAEAGPPMPLAIARLSAGQLPTTVRLDTSMGMVQGVSLEQFPRVIVGARISKSGNAQAASGDLEGFSAAIEWRNAELLELRIDSVRP